MSHDPEWDRAIRIAAHMPLAAKCVAIMEPDQLHELIAECLASAPPNLFAEEAIDWLGKQRWQATEAATATAKSPESMAPKALEPVPESEVRAWLKANAEAKKQQEEWHIWNKKTPGSRSPEPYCERPGPAPATALDMRGPTPVPVRAVP